MNWRAGRERLGKFVGAYDGNDVVIVVGCAFCWYGFEQIYRGLGPVVVGLYLLIAPRIK